MVEEDEDFVSYKDISELKKELEGLKGKKDASTKDIHDAVQKLAQAITDMLDVFAAAAEQMKLEEREHEAEAKKHEAIISKLDKILDQNKTIAEGMVSIVELIKRNLATAKEREEAPREEPLFRPKPEINPFKQPEWQLKPEPIMPRPQPMAPLAAPISPPMAPMLPPDLRQMPPLEPTPEPDFDFPEEPFELEEQPKKKGLFGMFKK